MNAAALALQTSLTRLPPARGLVPRRQLFEWLSAAEGGEVVVVCAPAGSGKTELLRSWVESEGLAGRVAWVTVERGERDAQRFWLSVIDPVAAAVGADESVKRVAATPAFAGEAVVERLLSDLHSLGQPLVLVIDDLHELRSPEALRLLELFMTRLPPELRVVIATRENPDLGLHRLRLAGALVEIRATDLRFSFEEARELMNMSGVVLSDSGLTLLHERTEGWAAGLRLAAISLARHVDPERFVTEFSGSERTVAGYLLAEVLGHQPPEVRNLLLRTSVLERINGPLADTLSGGTGSEAILQSLEDANAFVTSLDVRRSWFRYHQLLADLLRLELRRASPPALVDSLHRAAARWLDEHGYVVDAIRHAQAARDWSHATRLLADNYVDLAFDGRKATLSALLDAFPPGATEADGELALAVATGRLYDGMLDESAGQIAIAERLAATVPEERRPLFELQLTSARLSLACQRGDVDAARQAMRSLQAQPADTPVRGDDHRVSALMNLGIAELWSLHVDDARRDLEEALTLARRTGRPYLEIGCLGHLALATVIDGSPIPVGLRLSEEAVTLAEAHGWEAQRIVAPAVAARAAALAWLGGIDEADRWLERVERPHAAEPFETDSVLHFARAFVRLAQRRYEEALTEFRTAESMLPTLAREHVFPVELRSWILHTQAVMGRTAAARATLATLDAEERGTAGMRIAAAEIELAEGRPREAIGALAPLIADAPEPKAGGSPQVLNLRRATVHALLLDAVARDQLGDAPTAEASIERALEMAEQDGTILQFTLTPVRELLQRHPRHRTAHATLLSTILDVLDGAPRQPTREPTPFREELSDAELRVMSYLPSSLKATEIAVELRVSANTVRTHLRHIYAKLDAHSRGEAVARARELGLLAPGARRRGSAPGSGRL